MRDVAGTRGPQPGPAGRRAGQGRSSTLAPSGVGQGGQHRGRWNRGIWWGGPQHQLIAGGGHAHPDAGEVVAGRPPGQERHPCGAEGRPCGQQRVPGAGLLAPCGRT